MGCKKIQSHRQQNMEEMTERGFLRHPLIAWFVMMIGLPIALVLAVLISTAVITLPIAYLMGWV